MFADAITEAGPVELAAAKQPLVITEPITVTDGDASISALPGPTDRLEIVYEFEAPAPVGRQVFSFHVGADDFVTQLAPARTFSFEAEAREAQRRGIGKHLTPRDVLVIAPDGPIDNAFRFPDECARHKALDILGDLYLVGRPLRGRIVGYKSGHALNHLLAKRLLEKEARTAGGRPGGPRRGDGHQADPADPAPPLPDAAGRPGRRDRGRPPGGGDQERHVQRRLLSGPLPRHVR